MGSPRPPRCRELHVPHRIAQPVCLLLAASSCSTVLGIDEFSDAPPQGTAGTHPGAAPTAAAMQETNEFQLATTNYDIRVVQRTPPSN